MNAEFSTLEALELLCSSVPEWKTRLDDLNGQIDQRQIELARLEEAERPPTRSLRNKGSTESLRPHDAHENPFLSHELDNGVDIPMNPFESPKSEQNGLTSSQRPGSAGAVREVRTTPPPLKVSTPKPSPPRFLTRQISHPTPVAYQRPTVLRKRKTASLASGESGAPKYRTRSMIIVYYDSAVQLAFEELVKFVSGSRNAMRKGKMAVKMAEMKRAAELEAGDDDDDDDDDDEDDGGINNMLTNNGHLLVAQKKVTVATNGLSVSPGGIGGLGAADSDSALEADLTMPKLKFVSTRQMGPSRDFPRMNRGEGYGNTLSVGLLKGYRRGENGAMDIFDTLDKGLEWCQGQCEHAAHQFLRDGECTTEIENIKRKLEEVREIAQKEIEKMKKEEAANPRSRTPKPPAQNQTLQLKAPSVRKDRPSKDFQVDDRMEVDDEGVDDMDPIPQLMFKRSRDIAL